MLVKVFNDRGSCLAVMKISENILPGVVNIPTGAWLDPSKDEILAAFMEIRTSLTWTGHPN